MSWGYFPIKRFAEHIERCDRYTPDAIPYFCQLRIRKIIPDSLVDLDIPRRAGALRRIRKTCRICQPLNTSEGGSNPVRLTHHVILPGFTFSQWQCGCMYMHVCSGGSGVGVRGLTPPRGFSLGLYENSRGPGP